MEQQANELTAQQAISGNQVNVVILTRMGHNQTKDIIDLVNNVSQGYSDTVFTVVGDVDQPDQQMKRVDTIAEAIAQSTSRWMMFCDSATRLAPHALQRLVSKAEDNSANAVIAGLDRPNEGIFTLQDKLFATEVLKGIDVSEDDVRADGYITLQRIMMKARDVAGLGESILAKIDLNKMRSLLQPAHRELLYRMTTLYVEIQLCDRCNLDCAYCSHLSPVSKPVTISLETLEAECHRLARVGVDEVNLMGGEPLLHSQVCDAIKLTRSILPNIKLIVSTNGLLLPRMSKDFWQCCRDNKVVLRITPYPKAKNGTLNYFKYVWLIRKNRVRMESTGWRFGFRHQLLSEKAEYDATSNYLRCQLHCTQVRDATLWPCAYVAYAFNLNNKFGTNFKHAAGDSLPLDGITATDLRLWLLRTKPFCAHCGIKDAQRITWRRSQYTRDEWLKE
jgi:organic radical activating enzyme